MFYFYVMFLVNLPASQVFVNSLELFFWDIVFCQWVFIASGRAQYLTRVGVPIFRKIIAMHEITPQFY